MLDRRYRLHVQCGLVDLLELIRQLRRGEFLFVFFIAGACIRVATPVGVAGDGAIQATQRIGSGDAIGTQAATALKSGDTVDGEPIEKAADLIFRIGFHRCQPPLQLGDEIAGIAQFQRDIGR